MQSQNYNKDEIYKLRKSDFIPLVGLKRHMDRCVNESRMKDLENEEYQNKCEKRDALLAIYNGIVFCGTGAIISNGLLRILEK